MSAPTESPREVGAGARLDLPALAAVGLVLAVLGWLYRDTVDGLVDGWSQSQSYSHAFLLVPISLYLAWSERARIFGGAPRPSLVGLLAVPVASAAWAMAALVDIQVGQELALLAVLACALLAVLGWRNARPLAFPVGFLLLGIPVWSLLNPVLQDYTAQASASLVRRLGVPLYLEGLHMTIPRGQFVVAEICSGLRYLLASMCIGALYGYLNLRTLWLGVTFFAVATAASIVANWLRVVTIVMVGHHAGMDHPLVGAYHQHLGWVVFAVTLVPLFAFGAWLQRVDDRIQARARPREPSVPPVDDRRWWGAVTALAVIAVAAGPMLVRHLDARASASAVAVTVSLPSVEGWTGPLAADEPGHELEGRPVVASGRYRSPGGAEVDLLVARYSGVATDGEAVNELNRGFDRARWEVVRQGSREVGLPGLGEIVVAERVLDARGAAGRRLNWTLYEADGAYTASGVRAKLLQLRGRLAGRPAASFVALSIPTPPADELAPARDALAELAAAVLPTVVAPGGRR
ncbi:MAG: EpsI family protein [Ectothiorhodospiraceae bacterium]|nr:EpsI family protein [Chromatiales bacterium]MCP5157211.1 EpsI family protein [Ectothiorhodospiraceae bacterium]